MLEDVKISREALDDFTKITKYDILSYYKNVFAFLKSDYNKINNFYSGKTNSIIQQPFTNLAKCIDQTNEVITIFRLNSDHFSNYKFWELIYHIDSIKNTLMTVTKLSKWLRSSITNINFNSNSEIEVVLQQGQTLEDFNKNILNSNNQHNEWYDTAIRNNLAEEDYTHEGGNLLKVSYTRFGRIIINSIVDNIVGEKVYGLDLDKKLTFENNDLKVLQYRDTFIQTIGILSQLKKSDNPFFPKQGINKNFVVGTNLNMVSYPSIFRQMSETFSHDDSIKSFAIKDIRRDQDAIFLEFEVESKLSENSIFTVQLTN